ncbi:MAG: OmpA family protein [Cyclobacteriaceae bacterium]|nr:OmpA family protein [Cyclobacteriaceae bacterium]
MRILLQSVFVIFCFFITNTTTYCQIISFDSEKEQLGQNINTPFHEVKPIISSDGKTLYFCRQNHPLNIKGEKDDQDIYFSKYINNQWSAASNIGPPLNDKYANGINSVSGDGNTVLIFNGNIYDEEISGALLSRRTKMGWSSPIRLYIKDFQNYSEYEDYQLTSDNKFLLLAVDRDDSKGDQDLYVSFHQPDNSWGTPVNLGNAINTSKAEFSPFLASDGKTLYFASEGHNSIGNSDIFYAKRLDETWQNWSDPINLGTSINTAGLDAYFTIDAAGEYAYFVSMENDQRDIFRIKLHHEFKPDPVLMIFGYVYDAKTNNPIECEVRFEDLETGKELGIAHSNPEDGKYNIILQAGKKYGFRANASGHMAVEENIDLSTIHKYEEVEKDLFLTPIEVGQIIQLNNVFFNRGKYNLLATSYPTLNRLVDILNKNNDLEIELGGHTDNSGSSNQLNIELSLNRVESVKKYLVSKGIASSRLQTKGYGSSKPIASNLSEETRKLNRRVEFTILKN